MTAPVQGADQEAEWDLAVQHHLLDHLIPDEKDIPHVLFHYTTGDGLAGILRTRTIWATHIRYLNDAAEFYHGLSLIAGRVDALKQQGNTDATLLAEWYTGLRLSRNVLIYVAAFSKEPNSLPQWRAYARPFGFALGLDISHVLAVSNAPKDNVLIYPCVYKLSEQEELLDHGIRYLLNEYQKRTAGKPGSPELVREFTAHFLAYVLALSASFKHPAFEEEQEWRLVVRLATPDQRPTLVRHARVGLRMFVPYVELPLPAPTGTLPVARIVIGPTPDYDLAQHGLQVLLEDTNTNALAIDRSRVPFRDWQ